jgi:hypothetical protein
VPSRFGAALAAFPFSLAALPLFISPAAHAESLRCNGASATEGDSKASLLYKCGPPVLADTFCAPVYAPGALYPLPPSVANTYVPCQMVEEWLYDRGPGNLMATVRLRDGKVLSIRYSRQPQ